MGVALANVGQHEAGAELVKQLRVGLPLPADGAGDQDHLVRQLNDRVVVHGLIFEDRVKGSASLAYRPDAAMGLPCQTSTDHASLIAKRALVL